jgi:hypothetical protein
MKTLFVLIFFSCFWVSSFATIRTVSNIDSAAQYTTIQAAIDASNTGDSVFVSGSPINYASFTISDKKLAVFGPGWSPNNQAALTAKVSGCTINGAATTGSEIQGLTFIGSVSINSSNLGVNNLQFIRNKFQGIYIYVYYAVSNYLFEGNWFDNSILYDYFGYAFSNWILHNNIFYNTSNYNVYGFTGTNILFDHNLWYGPSSGSIDCFVSCQNLMLTNNIFVRRNAANGNSSSSFQTNITYLCVNDAPWLSNGNFDDSGNVVGLNPMMVDQTSVSNGIDNPLLNFTIASGPANNAGNDGKDMGLLYQADRVNWTRSRGVNLPFIYKMTIKSVSIVLGSDLEVTVDAKSN